MTTDESELHRRLVADLTDRLTEPALRCLEGDVSELGRADVVRVSSHDVLVAARCQTKAAAEPVGFEPNIHTASRAVALRSMQRLRRAGSVVAAVGETMRHLRGADRHPDDERLTDLDWLGQFLGDGDLAPIDVRVRIAARATTWLNTTLAILGVEDATMTRGWRYDIRPRWRYPGRGLSLHGRVDLTVPVDGNLTPVFVLGSLDPSVIDQAAFNLCLWTIRRRHPPPEAWIVELPTATLDKLRPEDLLDRGIEAAFRATDAVTARGSPSAPPDPSFARSPGRFVCADCAWAPICEARAEFDRRPARRGGIQLTP